MFLRQSTYWLGVVALLALLLSACGPENPPVAPEVSVVRPAITPLPPLVPAGVNGKQMRILVQPIASLELKEIDTPHPACVALRTTVPKLLARDFRDAGFQLVENGEPFDFSVSSNLQCYKEGAWASVGIRSIRPFVDEFGTEDDDNSPEDGRGAWGWLQRETNGYPPDVLGSALTSMASSCAKIEYFPNPILVGYSSETYHTKDGNFPAVLARNTVNQFTQCSALETFANRYLAFREAHNAPASGVEAGGPSTPPQATPAPQAILAAQTTPVSDLVVALPQSGSVALIIGVESYRSLPAPSGARTDAERMEAVMTRTLGLTSDRVRVLKDGEATRADILWGLEWVAKTTKPGGRVYFYFSGHGSPDPSSGAAYILPFESSADNLLHSGIKLDEVMSTLAQSKAREVVAMVDSCFSGMGERSVLPRGARPLSRVQTFSPPAQMVLLSASGGLEISGPASTENAGVFTKFVVDGLGKGEADMNGDGQISAQELFEWVGPRVTRDALSQHRKQTPQLTVGSKVGSASQVIIGYGYP